MVISSEKRSHSGTDRNIPAVNKSSQLIECSFLDFSGNIRRK